MPQERISAARSAFAFCPALGVGNVSDVFGRGNVLHKNYFFHKLFVTMLILTITPVILVSIFNLLNSRNLLEHEIHNTNNLLLRRIEENVSANFTDIKKDLAAFVLTSPELAYLQSVPEYEPQELNNRGFNRLLADSQDFSFDFLLDYSKSESSKHDAVVLSYSMPVGRQDYNVLLSVIINTQRLNKAIRGIGLTREGFITVTDTDDKLIAFYSHTPMESELQRAIYESALQRDAGATIVVNNSKYVFTSTVSGLNGWRYNAYIPMKEIAVRTESIKTFAYSAVGLFALTSAC